MSIPPSMTARIAVRRLPPPRLAGGISGSTHAHSSSVRSLGYLKCSRSYFARFLSVHNVSPSSNQDGLHRIQGIERNQEVLGRTLRASWRSLPSACSCYRRCQIGPPSHLLVLGSVSSLK